MVSAKTKNAILFAAITLIWALIDQVVKGIIRVNLAIGQQIPIIPGFFSLWHVQNTGAGFSLFTGWNRLLIWISIAVIGFIIYQIDFITEKAFHAVALGMVLGGALGNLIDRIFFGAVTDFFDFFIIFDHFPAFNVADAGITIGAITLIIVMVIEEWKLGKGNRDTKGSQQPNRK